MSEEEIELRDLVAQTLENNGVLSRIRDTPECINTHLKEFLSSNEGSLVTCLVREFLEFFHLDFTLSVFDPETAQGKYYNYGGRSKLTKDLQLENLNGKKGPLLVQILHIALTQNDHSSNAKKEENKANNGENTETSSAVHNPAVQINTLLNSNTPNTNIWDKTSAPQNITLLRTEVVTTKESSSNLTTETKSASFTAEASKLSTDINKVPKMKDIPLPAVVEDMSPISEAEHESHDSKNANRSKAGPLETTPHNSQTPEQSLTQCKPETQAALNSDSSQNNTNMSDYKKKQPHQTNKPDVEPVTRARTSTLSSLSNLPPLIGINHPVKQTAGSLSGINQSKDMHQIKAMIDIGLESQDNYDEDFNSSVSVSGKEYAANQGTDTEIEEELGSGVEDLLSSNSVLDDMTADATLSNLTGIADYIEDVK
ncbi:FGFR1 oncogene partner isoform X2 [Cryptotermes secundus]|uniref:FGFR1 oncogene partner isoform X2 n=1 Tax=Cryptotermes secundus TaxID=105785 RepID=UPI001454C665|nr:FGFR1 oncogene partner isoform X2 [Cryptotermes secundus]